MKAMSALMERVARAVGLADPPERTAEGGSAAPAAAMTTTGTSLLDELAALWQPMVAVPRAIAIAHDDIRDRSTTQHGGSQASAAWCVIDLDARVLSCESRGLWWDPFDLVPSAESGSGERLLLRSAERARSGSWWCEIVRGPRSRDAQRLVYYTDLTFSDAAIEPQRGVISGIRLRGGAPKP